MVGYVEANLAKKKLIQKLELGLSKNQRTN
jgi:hypothetical protein